MTSGEPEGPEIPEIDRWLAVERERTAAIPKYQSDLRLAEAAFLSTVVGDAKARYPDLVAIYLYGSRSENTARRNSDWDLLIQLPSQARFLQVCQEAGERRLARRIVDYQFCYETPSGGDFEHAMRIS